MSTGTSMHNINEYISSSLSSVLMQPPIGRLDFSDLRTHCVPMQ